MVLKTHAFNGGIDSRFATIAPSLGRAYSLCGYIWILGVSLSLCQMWARHSAVACLRIHTYAHTYIHTYTNLANLNGFEVMYLCFCMGLSHIHIRSMINKHVLDSDVDKLKCKVMIVGGSDTNHSYVLHECVCIYMCVCILTRNIHACVHMGRLGQVNGIVCIQEPYVMYVVHTYIHT
jgi:hypothetical protein